MCRLFALHSCRPARAAEDLASAAHSLRKQSRCDARGECHDSGWGIGHYTAGRPALVRSPLPAFSDSQFAAAAGVESEVILGHVRLASVGALTAENCHPFVSGVWMFAHNGTLANFDAARPRLLEAVAPSLREGIQGQTDSEHAFALALTLLQEFGGSTDRPAEPDLLRRVLVELVRRSLQLCPGTKLEPTRLNYILTDGRSLAATRVGHTLFRRRTEDGIALASEPTHGPDWHEVPDHSLVLVSPDGSLSVEPLGPESLPALPPYPAAIRLAAPSDDGEWLRLRRALWPDCPPQTHKAEMDDVRSDPRQAVLVAARQGGGLCGFVEVSIRPKVEGCAAGPVGYIEGWFVDADARRRGVGWRLLDAAEAWARRRGCREMASFAESSNTPGQLAHGALGYEVMSRLVYFRKPLANPTGLPLKVLPGSFAVCRLPADAPLPAWTTQGTFLSVTRTGEELSILCREEQVPEGVQRESGWRCLGVAGTLDFSLVGILASLLEPLTEAGLSVFAVSTFDTDYLLVRETDLPRALEALRSGHDVERTD